ncbi:hypothetical protein THOM_1066 [Trachipleistophora hominis]|uniref:Uncharacterized protein n=1 Tax=Trachipleistophora hominis TaxID=72359 RepID=L7JYX6_TRAHO|nr:hypothetical protein THOM_1066 [Trachipleistophora hominis]
MHALLLILFNYTIYNNRNLRTQTFEELTLMANNDKKVSDFARSASNATVDRQGCTGLLEDKERLDGCVNGDERCDGIISGDDQRKEERYRRIEEDSNLKLEINHDTMLNCDVVLSSDLRPNPVLNDPGLDDQGVNAKVTYNTPSNHDIRITPTLNTSYNHKYVPNNDQIMNSNHKLQSRPQSNQSRLQSRLNQQAIKENTTFKLLYKHRKHPYRVLHAIKHVSTIFDFLTRVILDEHTTINYLKIARTLCQRAKTIDDLFRTRDESVTTTETNGATNLHSIVLYLNHVLHEFKHRAEIIALVNTLYDLHSDYFLYVLKEHVIRNDNVKDVLAVVQHNSVHVFIGALGGSRRETVNSFFVDVMIGRARVGSALQLSNVYKLVEYGTYTAKKCAFIVRMHDKRYNVDYKHVVERLHVRLNVHVLYALIRVACDDGRLVAQIRDAMHRIRYDTMKRYGVVLKVLVHLFCARAVHKFDDIALFVHAMHELERVSANFNEKERVMYEELLGVLIEDERCMDVMVDWMMDRVFAAVVQRSKRRCDRRIIRGVEEVVGGVEEVVGDVEGEVSEGRVRRVGGEIKGRLKSVRAVKEGLNHEERLNPEEESNPKEGLNPKEKSNLTKKSELRNRPNLKTKDHVMVRLNTRPKYVQRIKELIKEGNPFITKNVNILLTSSREVLRLADNAPLHTQLLLLARTRASIHSYHHVVLDALSTDDMSTAMLCYAVIRKHPQMMSSDALTRTLLKNVLVNIRRDEPFYACVHLLIKILRSTRVDRRDVLRVAYVVNDRLNTVNKRFRERIGVLYRCMARWMDVRIIVNLMMDNLRVYDRMQRMMGVVVLAEIGVRYFCEVVVVMVMDYGRRDFYVKVGVVRVLERIVRRICRDYGCMACVGFNGCTGCVEFNGCVGCDGRVGSKRGVGSEGSEGSKGGEYCNGPNGCNGHYNHDDYNYNNFNCNNCKPEPEDHTENDNKEHGIHKRTEHIPNNAPKNINYASHKTRDIAPHKRINKKKYKTATTNKTNHSAHKKTKRYKRISTNLMKCILPVLNNALTQNDKTLRKHALQLLKYVLHLHAAAEHLIHLFNLFFVNLLCDDEIKEVFDECFGVFVRRLGSNYVFKYVVGGTEHASRGVRERYLELLGMVHGNGVLVESVDDDVVDEVF